MPSKIKRLRLKSRVVLLRDVSLAPHAQLKRGETGRIVALEQDDVGVWQAEVRFDKTHPGLSSWNNEALLTEPELGALTVARASVLHTVCSTAAVILACVVLAGRALHSNSVYFFGEGGLF
jgi:hypothetical protein